MQSSTEAQWIPVSECGICAGCGGLTIGGHHLEPCLGARSSFTFGEEVEAREPRSRNVPTLAPRRLRAGLHNVVSPDAHYRYIANPQRCGVAIYRKLPALGVQYAVSRRRRVGHRVERRQRAELRAAFAKAEGYVRKGYSLEMALHHAALGADEIQRQLRHRGIHASATTIRADLNPYRSGQLPRRAPGTEPHVRPALTYDLLEMAQEFGRLGQDLLSSLVLHALGPTNAPLTSITHPRVRAILKWAKQNARHGIRNELGRWLAWRCIEVGLPDNEVEQVMRSYWGHVRETMPQAPAYSWGEVLATLCHAYRRYGGRPSRPVDPDADPWDPRRGVCAVGVSQH